MTSNKEQDFLADAELAMNHQLNIFNQFNFSDCRIPIELLKQMNHLRDGLIHSINEADRAVSPKNGKNQSFPDPIELQKPEFYLRLVRLLQSFDATLLHLIKLSQNPANDATTINRFQQELNRYSRFSPILSHREEVLSFCRSTNQDYLFVDGGPRWGKSTLIPQILADFEVETAQAEGRQKRKVISAHDSQTVSQQVAFLISTDWNIDYNLPSEVGVCNQGVSSVSPTWIDLCDFNSLLQKFLLHSTTPSSFNPPEARSSSPLQPSSVNRKFNGIFDDVSYIVLDHVDVRSRDFELLFSLLTDRSLRSEWPHLKIVVMSTCLPPFPQLSSSATFQPSLHESTVISPLTSLIRLSTDLPLPVSVHVQYCPYSSSNNNDIQSAVEGAVLSVLQKPRNWKFGGTILVFLASNRVVQQMEHQLQNKLQSMSSSLCNNVNILTFCSSLSSERKLAVLHELSTNLHEKTTTTTNTTNPIFQIVLTTNFGENFSIPGVRYVIDTGINLERVTDHETLIPETSLLPISKSSLFLRFSRFDLPHSYYSLQNKHLQHIRLFTESKSKEFDEFKTPTILQSGNEWVTMFLVSIGLDPRHFSWLTHPGHDFLQTSIKKLTFLHALESIEIRSKNPISTESLKETDFNPSQTNKFQVTSLGRFVVLSRLRPELAYLFMEFCKIGCGEMGSLLVSLIDSNSFFKPPFDPKNFPRLSEVHRRFFDNQYGDAHSYINALKDCIKFCEKQKISHPIPSNRSISNFLSNPLLTEKIQTWCSDNLMNFECLLAAISSAQRLIGYAEQEGIWSLSRTQSLHFKSNQLKKTMIQGYRLNVSSLIFLTSNNIAQYGTIGTTRPAVAITHSSSALTRKSRTETRIPPPQYICYTSAERATNGKINLTCCFPVTLEEIREIHPEYCEELERKLDHFTQPLVIDNLPNALLSFLTQNNNYHLHQLQSLVPFEVIANEDLNNLLVCCPRDQHASIDSLLRDSLFPAFSASSLDEIKEESLGGSVRGVFRADGTIENLLFGSEFVTINLNFNALPSTASLDTLQSFGASISDPPPIIRHASLTFLSGSNESLLNCLGKLTYSSPHEAALALQTLNGKEILPRFRVRVSIPESNQLPSIQTHLSAYLFVNVSSRISKGEGYFRFSDYESANRLLTQLSLLDINIDVHPAGCPYNKDPRLNQPRLAFSNKQFASIDPIPLGMKFDILLKRIPTTFDELLLIEYLNRAAQRKGIVLNLSPSDFHLFYSNGPHHHSSSKNQMATFLSANFPFSNQILSIIHLPSTEKQQRTNTSHSFSSSRETFKINFPSDKNVQLVNSIVQQYNENPTSFPSYNGLPIRIETKYSMNISFESNILNHFAPIIEKTISDYIESKSSSSTSSSASSWYSIKRLSSSPPSMNNDKNSKQPNRSTKQQKQERKQPENEQQVQDGYRLSAPSLEELNKMTTLLRKNLSYSTMNASTHPLKILFSSFAKDQLADLSSSVQSSSGFPCYINLDSIKQLIHVYHPDPSQRSSLVDSLIRISHDLFSSLDTYEAWTTPQTKQYFSRQQPFLLKKYSLFSLEYQGLRLILSGSSTGIHSFREKFSSDLLNEKPLPVMMTRNPFLKSGPSPSSSSTPKEDGETCGICLCPIEKKYKLLACGHCGCQEDCYGRQLTQDIVSFPIRCVECSTPYSLMDIEALTPKDRLNSLRQQALCKFITEHPTLVRYCPAPGCGQLLDLRKVIQSRSASEEKTHGGNNIAHCESCDLDYCLSCSDRDSSAVEIHPSVVCSSTLSEEIRPHVLKVFEMMCKQCPRCKVVIHDFDGCFAIKCRVCSCEFCGYCMKDCGSDAHSHISRQECDKNPSPGEYFSSSKLFDQLHAERCDRAIPVYLRTLDPLLRERVMEDCRSSFKEIGMKFGSPPSYANRVSGSTNLN